MTSPPRFRTLSRTGMNSGHSSCFAPRTSRTCADLPICRSFETHQRIRQPTRRSLVSYSIYNTMRASIISLLGFWSLLVACCHSFSPQKNALVRRKPSSSALRSTKSSAATQPKLTVQQQRRRKTLLDRSGPFFSLDRMRGNVEFGSTANLVTQLDTTANRETIHRWLSDERRVALSIWDEKLIRELGDSVFRMQIMTLQFVTIQLKPSVDVKMWSTVQDEKPVFLLQSSSFDPNIQLLPGLGVPAESLGIKIEVVGELRPTNDGRGVTGKIAFSSGGLLPPPMRILPEAVLKAASDTINETVAQFAIQSFQRGATAKYREFRQAEQKREQ
jgi:hypothetical protein